MRFYSDLLSLDSYEKIIIGLFVVAICCVVFIGLKSFLDYEGYFCKPTEISGNTMTLNLWCGHDHKFITKNGKQYMETYGWAFGDFP